MRSATWARMALIWLGRAATSIQPRFRSQDDAVLGDAPLDDLVAAVANIADELGAGRAELALDRRFAADAADHLAAVASRCAPADAVGFEKHDGTPALGHRQCRRDAREAAADDAHVGLDRAFERRMARPVIGGRGVVRSYVILSLHVAPSTLSAPLSRHRGHQNVSSTDGMALSPAQRRRPGGALGLRVPPSASRNTRRSIRRA